MNKIDKPIVAYKVVTEEVLPQLLVPSTLERDEILTGTTYKIKTDSWAYYVTVNNHVVDGITRPYEVFINTKNTERYASLQVLTRLISAFFRTGHDYAFIADELKQIADPTGGYWKKGNFYASFEAELGELLEKHFKDLSNDN